MKIQSHGILISTSSTKVLRYFSPFVSVFLQSENREVGAQ